MPKPCVPSTSRSVASHGCDSTECCGTSRRTRRPGSKLGRKHRNRAILAEIYGWFTEGFDNADLKDSKALLDQLGG